MDRRSHQLPCVKSKAKSNINFTGFTIQYGGSTVATIDINPHECPFCADQKTSFTEMVVRALYQKYAASQNYFYSKDINDIFQQSRSRSYINFKDFQLFDDNEELFRRYYRIKELPNKLIILSEYYKYHKDVPRLFMMPTSIALSKYHDRKRRVEYIRITKMLNIKNDLPVEESSLNHQIIEEHKSLECLLDQLNETKNHSYQQHIKIFENVQQQGNQKTPFILQGHKQDYQTNKQLCLTRTLQSESNTLQEINFRLGELIGAMSPLNPYIYNNQSNISIKDEDKKSLPQSLHKKTDIQIIPASQRSNRKTEPDIKNNSVEKTTQNHPAVKRKILSLANQHNEINHILNNQQNHEHFMRTHINNFLQITELQKQGQSDQNTQLPQIKHTEQVKQQTMKKKKTTVSPYDIKASQTQRQITSELSTVHVAHTARESSNGLHYTQKQSSGKNQLNHERKEDLLKLLQRNPKPNNNNSHSQKRYISNDRIRKSTSRGPNDQDAKIVSHQNSGHMVSQQTQDPLITQLIEKLQQGNTNLFQQLLQITKQEKQRQQKLEEPRSSALKVSTNLGQSQKSLQQSNLSSLLKQSVSVKTKLSTNGNNNSQSRNNTKDQLKVNRQKRVNSQNMESNPFHLNLEIINVNSQQRIQTWRESVKEPTTQNLIPKQKYEPLFQNDKKIRQRGISHNELCNVSNQYKNKNITTNQKKQSKFY